MPSTKYEVASSALVLLGANEVSSFSIGAGATTEQKVCYHGYQTCLDQWLSLYDWRFAMKEEVLSHNLTGPVGGGWSQSYTVPSGMKKLRGVGYQASGVTIPYDRFENKIYCDVGVDVPLVAQFTYEPSVSFWPGYFVSLMEVALANKFAFGLAGQLDLKGDYEKDVEKFFRLAKSADSQQQTTRKLNLTGRGSIMEARRR